MKQSDGTPSEAEVVGISSTETMLPVTSSVASPDDATDDTAVRQRERPMIRLMLPRKRRRRRQRQPATKEEDEEGAVTQYIACHHFDPAILEAMLEQDLATIALIPAELIERLGLVDNGYTNEDMVRGD